MIVETVEDSEPFIFGSKYRQKRPTLEPPRQPRHDPAILDNGQKPPGLVTQQPPVVSGQVIKPPAVTREIKAQAPAVPVQQTQPLTRPAATTPSQTQPVKPLAAPSHGAPRLNGNCQILTAALTAP